MTTFDFIPYTYPPRVPGSTGTPMPSGGGGGAQPPAGPSGSVSVISATATMTLGEQTIFMGFPGELSIQRVMFAWNTRVNSSVFGTQSVTASVQQLRSLNTEGLEQRDVIEPVFFGKADSNISTIVEPKDSIEAFTPILLHVRCLNDTDPPATAWWETPGLQLWVSVHFISGEVF